MASKNATLEQLLGNYKDVSRRVASRVRHIGPIEGVSERRFQSMVALLEEYNQAASDLSAHILEEGHKICQGFLARHGDDVREFDNVVGQLTELETDWKDENLGLCEKLYQRRRQIEERLLTGLNSELANVGAAIRYIGTKELKEYGRGPANGSYYRGDIAKEMSKRKNSKHAYSLWGIVSGQILRRLTDNPIGTYWAGAGDYLTRSFPGSWTHLGFDSEQYFEKLQRNRFGIGHVNYDINSDSPCPITRDSNDAAVIKGLVSYGDSVTNFWTKMTVSLRRGGILLTTDDMPAEYAHQYDALTELPGGLPFVRVKDPPNSFPHFKDTRNKEAVANHEYRMSFYRKK